MIQKKYDAGIIKPKHVTSTNTLADLLIKPLERSRVWFICYKLSMYNVYTPACEVVYTKMI